MANDFDPYFKWLGIPPDEQPPNHYRLLGVPLFTDDADVLANAADRQMSHVRTFQSGKNAKLTQRILNEISAAKVCLLAAAERAVYDQTLRDSLNEAKKPTRIAKPVDAPKPATKPRKSSAPSRQEPVMAADPSRQPRNVPIMHIIVAVVALFVLIGAGIGLYVALFNGDAASEVVAGSVVRPAQRGGNTDRGAADEANGSAAPSGKFNGKSTATNGEGTDPSKATTDGQQGPTTAASSATDEADAIDSSQPPATVADANEQKTTDQAVTDAASRKVSFSAPDKVDGLELLPWRDGPFVMETVSGVTVAHATNDYLYFCVDDNVLFDLPDDNRQLVTIRVTFLDDVPGRFTLQYDGHPVEGDDPSRDGTWVVALPLVTTGSGQWKTAEFHLRRARFVNRQQRVADFRIACWDGYKIAVRSVEVEHRERTVYTLDEPVDLLKTVDLEKHQYWGEWSFDGKALVSPSLQSSARVQVPFNASDEYVLTVDVERVSGGNMLAIGLPVQGGQTIVSLDFETGNGLLSCLQTVDNLDGLSSNNVTRRFMNVFSDGVPTTITCIVRNTGVEVRQDGEPIVQFDGDLRRLDEGRVWDVPDRGAFIVGAWHSVYRITRMEIAPLDDRSQAIPRRRYSAAELTLVGLGSLSGGWLGLWGNGSNAVVEHEFPRTGDYVLRASAFESHAGDEWAEMTIMVDSVDVARFDVKALRDAPEVYETRVPIEAGRHRITVLFRNDLRTEDGKDRNLFLSYVEVEAATDSAAEAPVQIVRHAVPAKEARDAALAEIKNLFREDYDNARKPEELLALAAKLQELTEKLRAEPTERFVVTSEVWRLATEAGDAELAISALDELAAAYEIDAWNLRAKTLTAALRNAKSAEAKTAAAQQALELSEQAIAADRFGEAEDFAKTALAATSRARDAAAREIRTRATERVRNIKALEEQWKAVQSAIETLKTNADDPAANLTVGKYLCFVKGDWQRGLAHLTKSADPPFAAVVAGEQQKPADAQACLELGDAWWDLVRDAEDFEKQPIVARACHWYRRSLAAGLAGLERKRIEKRLQENDTTFEAFDTDLIGHWTFDEDLPTSVRDATGRQHGRVVGKVAWNRDGRLGPALQLNGAGYVSFDEADFGDQFTIALWVKLDEAGGVHCLVSNRQSGNFTAGFTLRANDANELTRRLSFDNADGTMKHWLNQPDVVQFGQWQHIAVTVSRADRAGFLYLDGKLIASSRTLRPDFPTRAPWRIGYYAQGSMKGLMDDLRIYRRMLTAEEIAVLSRM